ncbi:MAG: hypothetical protein ACTSRP_17770 [Candidatus Helarchaeota archaeon]
MSRLNRSMIEFDKSYIRLLILFIYSAHNDCNIEDVHAHLCPSALVPSPGIFAKCL